LRSINNQEADVQEELAEDVKDALSVDEVRSALEALTPADEALLIKAAKFFCEINSLSEPMSLLQEALTRALEGGRKCRRNLAFVPFLYGSMRSIAHSAAKSAKRSKIDAFAEPDEEAEEELSADAIELVTPEREAAARDALQRINDLFKGDEEILLLLYAMADGLKGKELRESLGWNETQHNSIRRRMMRKSETFAQDWS